MSELTTSSRDAKRATLRTLPVVCARNCPFRVMCDAASGLRATTPVAADLRSVSAAGRIGVDAAGNASELVAKWPNSQPERRRRSSPWKAPGGT